MVIFHDFWVNFCTGVFRISGESPNGKKFGVTNSATVGMKINRGLHPGDPGLESQNATAPLIWECTTRFGPAFIYAPKTSDMLRDSQGFQRTCSMSNFGKHFPVCGWSGFSLCPNSYRLRLFSLRSYFEWVTVPPFYH